MVIASRQVPGLVQYQRKERPNSQYSPQIFLFRHKVALLLSQKEVKINQLDSIHSCLTT